MSAQGGIFYTDARPVPDVVVMWLTQGMSEYAPDGVHCYRERGLAMAHGALNLTPESECVTLPLVSARKTVVTWDGRLDNRAEIIAELGPPSSVTDSDADLVCGVYERWGVPGLGRLIGDWSLAIYDASTQSVVLASDFMGVRPLYYHVTPKQLAWSSELGFFTQVADVFDDLEPRYVATFLMWGVSPELTPYRGVLSVPSAHAVIYDHSGRVTLRRIWNFTHRRIRYRDLAEYDEHLVACFKDAVASRLRTVRPAWSQLSGGLDSSSVTCMAADLISRREVPATTLRTVTFTSSQSPEWNERPFVQAVEARCGLTTHYADFDEHDPIPAPSVYSPEHAHPGDLMTQTWMRRDGARVLLSGRMGDAIMGHHVDNVESATDHLLDLRLPSYFRELYRWCLVAQMPLVEALSLSLVPLLPPGWQESSERRRLLDRHASADPSATHIEGRSFSLRSDFLKQVGPLYPALADLTRSRVRPGHRVLLRTVYRSALMHRLRPPHGLTELVMTYPYVDRRLVEFVLAIPSGVLYEPGRSRALMRRAFASFVPGRVLERFAKGYYAPAALRHLRPLARRAITHVNDLHVVRRGYVDAASLERRLIAVVNGSSTRIGNLRRIMRLEIWLDGRDSAGRPHRHFAGHEQVLETLLSNPTGKEVTRNVREALSTRGGSGSIVGSR